MMKDLIVIIVSWNCWDYLEQCIMSLEASDTAAAHDIVVVDNASTDGSVELITRRFPAVRVIENGGNAGFAAANNRALRETRGRYFLLLNPDTLVRSGALDTLVRFMDEHQEAWAAGPMMLNGDGSLQRGGVRFPSTWNILVEALFLDRLFPRSRVFGSHRELYEDPHAARSVDYLQGACLIVRAAAVDKIGPLDERFFMYFEETDWCYRMKQEGGQVLYCPRATVVHFGGGETGHYDERRLVFYHQSLLMFYRKHKGTIDLMILRAALLLRCLIRILVWLLAPAFLQRLRPFAASSLRGYLHALTLVVRGQVP